ncbi:MAG: hypothetical protein IJU35_04525 [Paludibacteraceae bacterium]|nr:hypothetical protein [Paludibacteraceae bacterium]
MNHANFSNIKSIEELRAKQARLANRVVRQERALSRHFAEFWAPWKTVSGTIGSIWSMTSSLRSSLVWWLAKPVFGKVLKYFKKR